MPQALGFVLFASPLGAIFTFGQLIVISQLAIGISSHGCHHTGRERVRP
jgi:hypothetical protein